jgi:hypothetical protein
MRKERQSGPAHPSMPLSVLAASSFAASIKETIPEQGQTECLVENKLY